MNRILCPSILLFVLLGCSQGSVNGSDVESPVAYSVEFTSNFPMRGEGFTLRVHANGQATVQAQSWDVAAIMVPAPIEPIGRLAREDRERIAALVDSGPPGTAWPWDRPDIFPAARLRCASALDDPPREFTIEFLYQPHRPAVPESIFAALDRVRELCGEMAEGDWESSAQLERAGWPQGATVVGGATFVYRGEEATTLHFGSGCQMRRVLIDSEGKAHAEEQICTMALTQLDFAHGQGRVFALDFDSGAPPDGWPRDAQGRLPAGEYVLRAELAELVAEVPLRIMQVD